MLKVCFFQCETTESALEIQKQYTNVCEQFFCKLTCIGICRPEIYYIKGTTTIDIFTARVRSTTGR